MYLLIKSYLLGLIDSLNSFKIFFQLYENKESRSIYLRLFIFNILISLLNIKIFNWYYKYINDYHLNSYFIQYTLYINLFLFNIFWNIPNYLVSLLYNGFYTNELIKCYINNNHDENKKLRMFRSH